MFQNFYKCEYGHGLCKAPETQCPHWQGTFCEMDVYEAMKKFDAYCAEHPEVVEEAARKFAEQFVDYKDVALGDKKIFTKGASNG